MTNEELEIEEWRREDREQSAYHEACHFVMNILVGSAIPRRITIEANEAAGYSGFCGGDAWCDAGEALRGMAGVFAEGVIGHGWLRDAGDEEGIEKALTAMYGADWEAHWRGYYDFTWKVLSYRSAQNAIWLVSQRLNETGSFAMEAVYPLLDDAERALGNRRKWLCKKVDDFMREKMRETNSNATPSGMALPASQSLVGEV